MKYKYVGCQTFGGGLDLGLVQSGLELQRRYEQKGGFGIAQCDANRELLGKKWDYQIGMPAEWEPLNDISVVASLPPCSGFSLMSVRAGNAGGGRKDYRGADAPVNSCMWITMELAARVNDGLGPTIVVMESVQGAGKDTPKGGHSLMLALRNHLEELTGEQYTLTHTFHNAASVGGCSVRRRYFLVLSKVPFGIETPLLKHGVPTIEMAIGDLDLPIEEWGPLAYARSATSWAAPYRNKSGEVDGLMTYGDKTGRELGHFSRVAAALSTGEWAPGQQMVDVIKRHYDATGGQFPEGWDAKAQATCLRTDFQGGVYQPQRWKREKIGRVLAGNGLTCIIHPWQDRTLTYREAARIMGFPDAWQLDSYTQGGGQAVYGKAVTVPCGRWVGGWIKRALDGSPGEWRGDLIGDREYKLDVSNDFKRYRSEKDGSEGDSRSVALTKEIDARPGVPEYVEWAENPRF